MKNLPILAIALCIAVNSCNTQHNSSNKEITQILTAEDVAAMTPDSIIEDLLAGNERFVNHTELERNGITQVKVSAESGQHPQAIVLSCIDSRVPVELLFDKGVGDIFVTRVAGNVVSDDILGSLEYACGHSTAKVVMVLGHSNCGAVHSAVEGANGGNMTDMLAKIHPAVDSCKAMGLEHEALLARVVEHNVHNMIDLIREKSQELAHLEKEGKIAIVGAIFDLETGKVELTDSRTITKDGIQLLPPAEFVKAVEADSLAVILDVRKNDEFEEGHIKGAQLLDFLNPDSFTAGVQSLDSTKNYYIHCRSGVRSHNAALHMKEAGLTVYEMHGGILAYQKADLPLETNSK